MLSSTRINAFTEMFCRPKEREALITLLEGIALAITVMERATAGTKLHAHFSAEMALFLRLFKQLNYSPAFPPLKVK